MFLIEIIFLKLAGAIQDAILENRIALDLEQTKFPIVFRVDQRRRSPPTRTHRHSACASSSVWILKFAGGVAAPLARSSSKLSNHFDRNTARRRLWLRSSRGRGRSGASAKPSGVAAMRRSRSMQWTRARFTSHSGYVSDKASKTAGFAPTAAAQDARVDERRSQSLFLGIELGERSVGSRRRKRSPFRWH